MDLHGFLIRRVSRARRPCLTLALVVLPLSQTSFVKSAQSNTAALEDVLIAWDKGCAAIRSYDVFLSCENETLLDAKDWSPRETPLVANYQSREVFRLGKRRIEPDVRRPGEPPALFSIWDGEIAKEVRVASKQLIVDVNLLHVRGTLPDFESWYRSPGGKSFADIMRERPATKLEAKDADQCVLYTPPTDGRFEWSPFGFRVWLDLTKNALPSRIEYLLSIDGREVVYRRCDNSLDEVAPGVWAPVKVVTSGFPPIVQADVPPRRATAGIAVVYRVFSSFNNEVPDSVFDVQVSPGTEVNDRIAGARYIFGKANDAKSHLSEAVLRGQRPAADLRLNEKRQ